MGTRKCLSFPFKYKRSLNSNSGKMGLAGFLNKVAIPCPNNNKKRTEGPESLLHPEEAAYPPPDHHPDLGFSKYERRNQLTKCVRIVRSIKLRWF